MHRTYTAEEYRELVAAMRERVPNLAISTDVIVGFCGETEQDFTETCDLMREIRYDSAFMFKYSPREGTLAYRSLDDDVSEEEKGQRLRTVIELQEEISYKINQETIGKSVEVLVEGESRRESYKYQGKTDNFKTTVFPKANAQIGDIVNVTVESASAHTLVGKIHGLRKFQVVPVVNRLKTMFCLSGSYVSSWSPSAATLAKTTEFPRKDF